MSEVNAGGPELESRQDDLTDNFQKDLAPEGTFYKNAERINTAEERQMKPQHENPIVAHVLEEVDAQIEILSRKHNSRREKRALRPKHYVRSNT